jgi:hypothetical protein
MSHHTIFNEGFPLISIMTDITSELLTLLNPLSSTLSRCSILQDPRLVRQHRSNFRRNCERSFDNDVMATFMEYFYHIFMSFMYMWRFSMIKLIAQFETNLSKLEASRR